MAIINTKTCSNCGASSALEEGFIESDESCNEETICITCYNYENDSDALQNYKVEIPGLIVVGLILVYTGSKEASNLGWFLINVSLFLIVSFFTTIIHELGHAFTARLTGQDVIAISFGRGKNIFSKKVFDTYLDFKKIPLGGLTFYLPKASVWFRTKTIIITAAGPIANLLVAWLLWEQMKRFDFVYSVINEVAFIPIFFLSNLVTGCVNLIPFRFSSSVGEIWTDGGKILTTPFMNEEAIESYQFSGVYSQAFVALQHEDYKFTQTFSEDALRHYPDDRNLKNILGIALLEQGEFSDGRSIFREIITEKEISLFERGLYLNNIAYANYRMEDPILLEESLELSEEAFNLVPWELAIRSTRGSILIEAGQLEAGIKLLNDRRYQMLPDPTYANVKSTLAIGYAKQGKIELARKTLQRAKDFDPDNEMAKRAETFIQKESE